jgi:hypothetical protein
VASGPFQAARQGNASGTGALLRSRSARVIRSSLAAIAAPFARASSPPSVLYKKVRAAGATMADVDRRLGPGCDPLA